MHFASVGVHDVAAQRFHEWHVWQRNRTSFVAVTHQSFSAVLHGICKHLLAQCALADVGLAGHERQPTTAAPESPSAATQ